MKEIIGVSLSRFHDSEDQFEFLIATADGREVGYEVTRRTAQAIHKELSGNLDLRAPTPPPSPHLVPFSQPRCQCEFPMIKYGGKTVACDHCGLPPGRTPAPEKHEAPEIDGGRFEEWSLADFAAQCRMQSREQLDPEFARFMAALAKRLSTLTPPPQPIVGGWNAHEEFKRSALAARQAFDHVVGKPTRLATISKHEARNLQHLKEVYEVALEQSPEFADTLAWLPWWDIAKGGRLAELTQSSPAAEKPVAPQCCMCGKKGLSTVEGDGGTECELEDGRWVCSAECWDRAIEPPPSRHEAPEIDGGRFEEWSLADFAAQCRMQSREQLDPEFARFMAALAKRLSTLTPPPQPNVRGLVQAARDVIASAFDTYKKRNGHLASFEDGSGEKCWIVPFDAFEELRSAVDAIDTSEAETPAPEKHEAPEIDGGRFEEWSLADFAAQCRMQSREQLDPEFARFMAALAKRLSTLTPPPQPNVVGDTPVVREGKIRVDVWGGGRGPPKSGRERRVLQWPMVRSTVLDRKQGRNWSALQCTAS